ncbi:MAG: tetratricopeptide repeat protein [Armatimonadetes bacterium]|nr:tetratricopeptide repeat protein [Armatimonadota bacterium]
MRVLFDIGPVQGRGLLEQAVLEAKPMLPRGRWRLALTLAGFLGGATLFAAYVWLMMHSRSWQLYVVYAAVGGCLGVIAVILPRVIWHFFSKQWHRLLLRQYLDRAEVLAAMARRKVAEIGAEGDRNDRAVVGFLSGDYAPAAEVFAEVSREGNPEASANLLATLGEAGEWERVREILRTSELDPNDLLAPNLARIAALTTDQDTLRLLHELTGRLADPVLLNNLGVRSLRLGQFAEARQAFTAALRERPTYAPPQANLGVLAYREGHLARAVSAMSSAAALSADPVVFSNLGAALAQAGETRAALEWLTKAERLQPRHAGIQVNLGNAYALDGKVEEATEAFSSALHIGAHQHLAHYDMALVFLEQGERERALEAFREAERLAPGDPETVNNIGCLHFAAQRYQEALECFQRLQNVQTDGLYGHNLVRAQLAAGRSDEARELLNRIGDEETETALERGLVFTLTGMSIEPTTETHRQMRSHNLRQAIALFQGIVSAGRGPVAEASFNLGLAHYLEGDYQTAGDTLAAALKQHPTQTEMHYLTGMCYVLAALKESEQHERLEDTVAPSVRELFLRARPHFERSMELPAFHEASAHDLGLLFYLIGDYAKAVEVLRKVVRTDSPPWIMNALALAQARRAQELQRQAQTATLMAEGRKQQIRQEARTLLTSAIHYFRIALEARPDSPLSHANLGLALMLRNDRGDVEAALQHWQRMHQLGDARARKTYEEFMQSMSPEAAQALQFQDVELAFRPIRPHEWITLAPPRMCGPRYVIEDVMDIPEWRLYATHPLIRRCLNYRHRAERERQRLQRLAV